MVGLPKLTARAPERDWQPGRLNPHTPEQCDHELRSLPNRPLSLHCRRIITDVWLDERLRAMGHTE